MSARKSPSDAHASAASSPAPDVAGSAGRTPLWRRRWVRRILIWGTAAVVVLGGAVVGVGLWMYSRAVTDTVGELDFANPLKIPPVLEPEMDAEGRQHFSLNLQKGETEFKPGTVSETWGVNGSYLGPTLRASHGDEIVMHVENELPEPTTLHWHGMHLPAAADGNPHSPIAPGETWSPTWEIDQPAATLWYHPHPHGETANHVYRGVAGLFLLDDDETPDELPSDYGDDDIPIIIQDKSFAGEGSLQMNSPMMSSVGQLGDEILINGTHDPHVEVDDEMVRLRVLNASNARAYNLGFDDDRPFDLVGTDGGLLEEPHTTSRIQVSAGERVEIVVPIVPGERMVLRSYSPELGMNFFQDRFSGGDDRFDLIEIRSAAELAPAPALPDRLAPDTMPDPGDAVTTREFELSGQRRINGASMDMKRVNEVVAVDTTEIWEVTNDAGMVHNFHVHDVQFRIVEYDGAPPPPHLVGPKDTVFLPPGVTARLAVRFEDYTDPEVPYMYHCHLLRHEDRGMMAQFTVVEPSDVDRAPRHLDVDHHP